MTLDWSNTGCGLAVGVDSQMTGGYPPQPETTSPLKPVSAAPFPRSHNSRPHGSSHPFPLQRKVPRLHPATLRHLPARPPSHQTVASAVPTVPPSPPPTASPPVPAKPTSQRAAADGNGNGRRHRRTDGGVEEVDKFVAHAPLPIARPEDQGRRRGGKARRGRGEGQAETHGHAYARHQVGKRGRAPKKTRKARGGGGARETAVIERSALPRAPIVGDWRQAGARPRGERPQVGTPDRPTPSPIPSILASDTGRRPRIHRTSLPLHPPFTPPLDPPSHPHEHVPPPAP